MKHFSCIAPSFPELGPEFPAASASPSFQLYLLNWERPDCIPFPTPVFCKESWAIRGSPQLFLFPPGFTAPCHLCPKVWKQLTHIPVPGNRVSRSLVVCLWWEVKFNPYYSQIVQQEWEQFKYHGLICLVSECPSEPCERRPDSPALLVCLGVLGLLWAEVQPVFKEMYFSYNMAPQCKSMDSRGAHSKNKDLSSQEEEVLSWTSWDIVCYSPVEQTSQGPFLL